jgi:hypothetical protein
MDTRRTMMMDVGAGLLGGGGAAGFPAELLTDLVLALNLDETSGTRYDASGLAHDAAQTGTVGRTTGIVNYAATSTAWNTGYLKVTYHADLRLGDNDWEMSFCIRMPGLGSFPTVMGQEAAGSGQDWTVWLDTGTNKMKFEIPGPVRAISTVTIAINTWYMVRVWHDKTADKIGISVNEEAAVLAAKVGGITDNSRDLVVGGQIYSGNPAPPNAIIDRVYRWNRVLSSSERILDYNSGAPKQVPF